jgi:inorganic pyrophosphatase/exopolyphosphatase
MDIRLKFKNPVTHDDDLAASICLATALEIEEYQETTSQNEFNVESTSRELVTVDKSVFSIGRERILSVKMSFKNKNTIADMIKSGAWEYVDAVEQSVLEAIPDPEAPKQIAVKR